MFAAVGEFLKTLDSVPGGIEIKFTMLDYFREDEILHFLNHYTEPSYPLFEKDASLEWTDQKFSWPRRMVFRVRTTNVVRRWDVVNRSNYREDAWNGYYEKWMFQKVGKDVQRLPNNFEELVSKADENDASVMERSWDNEAGFSESVSMEVEKPFEEGKLVNWIYWIGTEYWSKKEPKLEDASWRAEAKAEMTKRIEEVNAWNRICESSDAKAGMEPKVVEPAWLYIVKKINLVEEEIERNGKVTDTGLYEWSEDESEDEKDGSVDETEDASVNAVADELNDAQIDGPSFYYVEESTYEESEAGSDDENDGPKDEVRVVSASDTSDNNVDASGTTKADSSGTSYVTSSEDDRAQACDAPPPRQPTGELAHNFFVDASGNEWSSDSQHIMRFSGRIWGWKRPCLKGFHTLVMGDSSIRQFARRSKKIRGYGIFSYRNGLSNV